VAKYDGPDPCPDGALRHGPPDSAGRCPWCRTQIEAPLPAPRSYAVSELTDAYGQHYDPDYEAPPARASYPGRPYY
jgi:hypothetical protein